MIKMNRRWVVYLLGLVVVVGIYLLYLDFFSKGVWKVGNDFGSASTTPEFIYFSALDGRGVTSTEKVAPQVVAVMVDNHVDARAQLGLIDASVVYEAPVEGNITRFMALYDAGDTIEEIGPVRSARAYYLDWLMEYGDALYLHVGGSPEALELIKKRTIFDANEFYWGSYYWRAGNRFAPHNVLTKSENWQKIIVDNSLKHPLKPWEGWKFNNQKENRGEPIAEIKIKYDPVWGYNVGWKYVPTVDKFVRYINSTKHLDANGSEIIADNIIVQTVKVTTIDDYGRKAITTVGEGEMFILKNGYRIRGRWKKESLSSRTRFYDRDGKEIELLPGKTWVQVISYNTTVETTEVNE